MILSIMALAVAGFCICIYVNSLEKQVALEPEYKAACDLSDTFSCTKPIKSPYAHLFYLSNGVVGMLAYVTIFVLALFDLNQLLLPILVVGALASCYLAYILYFRVKSVCILCTSLYLVNFTMLALILVQ